MDRRIFKYELDELDVKEIEMPQGAEILCVQTQRQTPCIWALVDPESVTVKRKFEIYGTGEKITENTKTTVRKYIGTYQVGEGYLVWHVFEVIDLIVTIDLNK